ncbi:MAG: carbon storage regulator, partial [Phycisphaerae bacterium]
VRIGVKRRGGRGCGAKSYGLGLLEGGGSWYNFVGGSRHGGTRRVCSGGAYFVARRPGSGLMLVITRREGEEIVIGDPRNPIGVVRIASIKGERVRVAFDFPREVEIHRREIAEQIAAQEPTVVGTIRPATGT